MEKAEEARQLIKETRRISKWAELNRVYCSECKGTETGEDGVIVHKEECIVADAENFLKNKDSESQIEKCINITVDLWNEYLELPIEHPNEVNEFATALHSLQDMLGVKIARIYRPDIFPKKVKDESNL